MQSVICVQQLIHMIESSSWKQLGRDAGWLTLSAAYGLADLIVVPEVPYQPDRLAEAIREKHTEQGNVIVVVSEGIRNDDGEIDDYIPSGTGCIWAHKTGRGCSEIIVEAMKKTSSRNFQFCFPSPLLILGYLQRCGSPNSFG